MPVCARVCVKTVRPYTYTRRDGFFEGLARHAGPGSSEIAIIILYTRRTVGGFFK